MSEHVERLAQEIATFTPLQLHVLSGLIAVCEAGLVSAGQPDLQEKLNAVADKLRSDFEGGAK